MPKNPIPKIKTHEFWMARALHLAERGRLSVSPNPMVGACVVGASRLIAEGWHQRYGGDHAEIIALKRAGMRARGAVLYVTLEPCSSWGKTPPCVSAIIRAGIRQVVIGSRDPNPRHRGRGITMLKRAGITVHASVLAGEVARQNEAFFKYIRTGLPFVSLKMAQSLDGKIASVSGSSRWISSALARGFVHRLRAAHDAVLVGTRTLLMDDPRLGTNAKNRPSPSEKPWRVALDPRVEVSPSARILSG
jgi:diaminohydroxyphosphoribosylaminopyrimidine deaminase/5-amino-6-(5-phosphoribosylamino)uracil reductase